MRNNYLLILLLAISLLLPSLAQGGDSWEVKLAISSGTASSRLSFGVKDDATAGQDGLYDVPAMLSGTLQARFLNGGGELWRDFRRNDQDITEWRLKIDATTGSEVTIAWDKDGLPTDLQFELIDEISHQVVSMSEQSSYTSPVQEQLEFLIRVRII